MALSDNAGSGVIYGRTTIITTGFTINNPGVLVPGGADRFVVFIDASAGPIVTTVNVPAGFNGTLVYKRIDGSGNSVQVQAPLTLIDNSAAPFPIPAYGSMQLISDGGASLKLWRVL